nr:hypothetical protein [Terriglobales bacterium]
MRVKEIIAFLAEVLVAAKALVRELLRWKYSSVFGGGVWFLGAGAMIGHEYIVALVAFIIGSSWLIGWWLTERKGSVYDKWLGVIVIAAITAGLCIYSYRLYRTQLLDDYEGALIPANEPAPPNICGGISGEGEVVILGTAAAYSHT